MNRKKSLKKFDYVELLGDLKQRIHGAQVRAVQAVNAELVRLYWDIGRLIDARQTEAGWGAAVIPRLSRDLCNELPEIKGFSERNIKLMVQFSQEYPHAFPGQRAIGQPPVAQLQLSSKGQPPVAEIPWAHNILLMQRVKNKSHRHWYMAQTLQNGWSRNVLTLMIDSQAHARQGNTIDNFAVALPTPQSDLVQQTLKDPYIFDFLTLDEPFHERELETNLLQHLEKFLLELGQGFAFVGRQYRCEVGGDDFSIDLLFYHLRLRAFVVIDLKTGEFRPEYAGKMNFYLGVVDNHLRHPADAPSIGLILCREHNRIVAEYALRDMKKPIGISKYALTRSLPKELQTRLPSIEAIEAELASPVRYASRKGAKSSMKKAPKKASSKAKQTNRKKK